MTRSDKNVSNMMGDGTASMEAMIKALRDIYARQAELQEQTVKVLEVLTKEFDRLSDKPEASQFHDAGVAPETKPEPKPANTNEVGYSELRKLLASISAAGKTAEVKALIKATGAAKLPDVPNECWRDLYEKAKALKGGE